MAVGPCHRNLARFQRLPQTVEYRALELGQLIQKQNAEMRQTDLARFHLQAAADQRRHRRAVMRIAIGPLPGDPPIDQRARNRCDHRNFQRF